MNIVAKENTVQMHASNQHGEKIKIEVGKTYQSAKCGKFSVLEIVNSTEVKIKFSITGFIRTARAASIARGQVKDPMMPVVYGVGFLGDGNFTATVGRVPTKAYSTWYQMIRRCYDEKSLKRNPNYIGCEVCEEWRNFQNFAEWFNEKAQKSTSDINLDKDILSRGNKVYSPSLCLLVPGVVNKFFISFDRSTGKHLTGATMRGDGRFEAFCRDFTGNSKFSLGTFDTEIEAHNAWRKKKSEMVTTLAEMVDDKEISAAILDWKMHLHPLNPINNNRL